MSLVGRTRELQEVTSWLEEADPAAGRGVLVLEGEAGIGKTSLLAAGLRIAHARDVPLLNCRASGSESKLSYVGLADLLSACPDAAFDALPAPQRHSLDVALLRAPPGETDLEPRAVGTALLGILRLLAGEQRVIVAVDDWQWLDSASARAVVFALRRADGLARLLASRRSGEAPGAGAISLTQLEAELGAGAVTQLSLGPLSVAAVHEMIREHLGASLARPVLVKVHAASAGNPFYALEIAREVLRRGELRPGEPLPVPADHHDVVLLRVARLPRRTREALVAMAALPRPRRGDLDESDLEPAMRNGIVQEEPDGRLVFAHPLFGSVLYASTPATQRRAMHRRLAECAVTPEQQALHRALGAEGPEEETAQLLDAATLAALRRGAADAAVELKELACRLTPAEDEKATLRRRIELADRRYFAGDASGARRELESLLVAVQPGEERAQVLLELGTVLWTQGDGRRGLELLSQALGEARESGMLARVHSRISGLTSDCDQGLEHAEAALELIDEHEDPMLYSFALHNMAMWKLYARGEADHGAIERGVQLQAAAAVWEMSMVPAVWARFFDDFATSRRLHEDLLHAFEEIADLASAAGILAHVARLDIMMGHTERARSLADESLQLAVQTEQEAYVMLALGVRSLALVQAGELEAARRDAEEILRRIEPLPDADLELVARSALGLAAVAGGDPAEADRQLSRVAQILEALHNREPASHRVQADHAEAVIQLGELERAEELVAAMERRAERLPRPWILAVSARCRGMLRAARGDLDGALVELQRAVALHDGLEMPVERGRTLLALGRLHRRRGERTEAQRLLEAALADFDGAGAGAWSATTRRDLGRARPGRGRRDELTSTELAIAELAASGRRNDEIAAQLFVTTKTVEANLTRVYRKLGIRSRAALERQLSAQRARGAHP